MKIFDILYYAVYCFGRRIGQRNQDARACAGTVMPLFFTMSGFFVYCILMSKLDPKLLPPKSFKPGFLGLVVFIWIVSFIIFEIKGHGQRIIPEFEKSKNQIVYLWLGAIFSVVTISLPVLMWFLLRAIM